MPKSKFEILLDKASELILAISHVKSPIKTGILTGVATLFIFMAAVATIGFFGEGLIAFNQHILDNYRNKSRYCEETIKIYIIDNKKTICQKYTTEHIDQICEPLINNLNKQDNVKYE